MTSEIKIKGASSHNLKNVTVRIPHNSLTTVTGVSGSGKSSLAFDTIYAEAERRYVESLSAYARQFIGQKEKSNVEHIDGLSPAISIDQKTVNRNPRSTVGTITEVFDYLRVLFARAGRRYCPECGSEVVVSSEEDVVNMFFEKYFEQSIAILAPVVRERKGEHRKILNDLIKDGYVRVIIDSREYRLDEIDEIPPLKRYRFHTIQVVLDRLVANEGNKARLIENIEKAFEMADGFVDVWLQDDTVERHSSSLSCSNCQTSLSKLDPRDFSFNTATGACSECKGRGTINQLTEEGLIRPDISIDEGAIKTTTRRLSSITYTGLRMGAIKRVGEQLGFKVDIPWREISKEKRDIILYGINKEVIIPWHYGNESSGTLVKGESRRKWRGIIPMIMGTYTTTHSLKTRTKIEAIMNQTTCSLCKGQRLRQDVLATRIAGMNIIELSDLPIDKLYEEIKKFGSSEDTLGIFQQLLAEIEHRLEFLMIVGLSYINLNRRAPSLSGGESQRIRLATQLGSFLQGVTYILDEPSIGLHPRDNEQLLHALFTLRDHGNTVLVVEHDEETIRSSDYLIDIGPGAGERGGEITFEGKPDDLVANSDILNSSTRDYLSGEKSIEIPSQRRKRDTEKQLVLLGVTHNNLKSLDVSIPLGLFVAISGVSGSGKSSLVHDVLYRALKEDEPEDVYATEDNSNVSARGRYSEIEGRQHIDKVIIIDQKPIGKNSRSNPATYTKVLNDIRKLYADTPDSKIRGYTSTRFTFNTEAGRCITCKGMGYRVIEMQLLPDVEVPCEICEGKRYDEETLEILYKGKSIADVLGMMVDDALVFFENIPSIQHILQTLQDVGLGYLRLGQSAVTLSGGEAQRMKLASELRKKATGNTLYIMDEPTTGLHFDDIKKLLEAMNKIVDAGNSLLVIEHNLEILKSADWLIDLGPEGGDAGGTIVAEGSVEMLAKLKHGYTGKFLADALNGNVLKFHPTSDETTTSRIISQFGGSSIEVEKATQHNLKAISLEIPKGKITTVSGPSGSGKTSLVMDTIFLEGQRRFVESLSSYARQFLRRSEGGNVQSLTGLSPAIAIDQRVANRSPRSTVATSTEIYDYLRVLFANFGKPECVNGHGPVKTWTNLEIFEDLLDKNDDNQIFIGFLGVLRYKGKNEGEKVHNFEDDDASFSTFSEQDLKFMNELVIHSSPEETLPVLGVSRILLSDFSTLPIEEIEDFEYDRPYWFIVDRLVVRKDEKQRIIESIEKIRRFSQTVEIRLREEAQLSKRYPLLGSCIVCSFTFPEEVSPRMFSFNHYLASCPTCAGLGYIQDFAVELLAPDKTLSVVEGAVKIYHAGRFENDEGYYYKKMEAVCDLVGVSLYQPLYKMKKAQLHHLFYGKQSQEEDLNFVYTQANGKTQVETRNKFIGLIPQWRDAYKRGQGTYWKKKMNKFMTRVMCSGCNGNRLSSLSLGYKIGGLSIIEFTSLTPQRAIEHLDSLSLSDSEEIINRDVIEQIKHKCHFLINVGLDYLQLNMRSDKLSGGEAQRIRLASQLGSSLVGVLYCLDEPTIGLHPRDTHRLLKVIRDLKDKGNTVLIVEHDTTIIENSDFLVDMGPGAGVSGGEVVSMGDTSSVLADPNSITGQWIERERNRVRKSHRGIHSQRWVELHGVKTNNLKNISVNIPLEMLTCITGVSGSGKSSLIQITLSSVLCEHVGKTKDDIMKLAKLEDWHVPNFVTDVRIVDQSPISKSPRSNAATYSDVWTYVRQLFAIVPGAKARGFTSSRFSFNSKSGRCKNCAGLGYITVELLFIADVSTVCPTCQGKRFNLRTLSVSYRGKNVSDVLKMTVQEASDFFGNHPNIKKRLQTLVDVGLGYLPLGQATSTLSGGEAQRMKLAKHLVPNLKQEGHTVILLDEPTTGLHASDVDVLIKAINYVIDQGNSVIVVEHNVDFIKNCDWIMDLGPEGGNGGGQLICEGTPEKVAKSGIGMTAQYL